MNTKVRDRMRSLAATAALAFLVLPAGPAGAHVFTIDEFTIVKNGTTILDEDFTNGDPATGPNFSGGGASSYGLDGGGFSEAGTRVTMDNSLGQPTQFGGDTFLGNFATLLTNRQEQGTGAGQSNSGLKRNATFSVMGTYDLVLPTEVGEFYGIRLTDRVGGGQAGNDVLELIVRRSGSGDVEILFRDRDFTTLTTTVIDSVVLGVVASGLQIDLILSHDIADTNDITASYIVIDSNDNTIDSHTFANMGSIFGDETWTRAQYMSVSPVPEPAVPALLALGLAALALARRRRPAAAGAA